MREARQGKAAGQEEAREGRLGGKLDKEETRRGEARLGPAAAAVPSRPSAPKEYNNHTNYESARCIKHTQKNRWSRQT